MPKTTDKNRFPHNDLSYLKPLLDERVERFNCLEFIETDPIQIPHRFRKKEDIEIAAFFAATFAWGQRKSIISSSLKLMNLLDNDPFDFVCQASSLELDKLSVFVHRTFNGTDCRFFIESLRNVYLNKGGLEHAFCQGYLTSGSAYGAIAHFRSEFTSIAHEKRSEKHVADVTANASAKRLNMFLRWMVRSDKNDVDFGLWKGIPASALMLPLDVHTGNVARAFGMLSRNQNDWKAVEEITAVLRQFDPIDPIRYDFALFGMGAKLFS
jgi:uncharacterized protein (TIGR02757 family)